VDDGRRTLTVANRGLAEVEAIEDGQGTSLAVTLLRAVGWLSRSDLALRPGDAGPPLPTPGAQVPGPHRAELSLRLDDTGAAAPSAHAHRFAYPPLAVVGGAGPAAPVRDGDSLVAVSDPLVLLTAIEPRAGGAAIVRGYNASSEPRRVRVRWLADPGRRLEPIDLAESHPRGPVADEEVELELRPWEIFNLRVRAKSPRGEPEPEPG
jgi:alpha-mannosidase